MNCEIKNTKKIPFILKLIYGCVIFLICFMLLIAAASLMIQNRLHIGEFTYSINENEISWNTVVKGVENSLRDANLSPSLWKISNEQSLLKTNLFLKTNFNEINIDLKNQDNGREIFVHCYLVFPNMIVYDLYYRM